MLALATHEPHFSILREYVGPTAGGSQGAVGLKEQVAAELEKAAAAAEDGGASAMQIAKEAEAAERVTTPFQFLHIGILREYLHKEFAAADFGETVFELERVIDDFIFLCFFVGNDFLPHLPSLEIRQGAIDTLADLYKTSFKELGGYICDGGEVNIARAKQFCTDLGNLENELLARRKVQEDRDRQREQRKKRDVQNRAASGRHADMLRRMSQTAQLPGHSEHLQRMRGVNAAEATRTAATNLSGDDQMLLPLFDAIKGE
eukprot:scaffold52716_cov63-Phaeocystis_antarctica.AAC.3